MDIDTGGVISYATYETTADVFILVLVTAYTLGTLCYIKAMWHMRKQFLMALRSPTLGCLTGGIATLRSCSLVYAFLLDETDGAGDNLLSFSGASAALALISSPATLIGNTSLIVWAVRLVVLYDPTRRRKYGRYVKERSVVRALCWAYAGVEAVIWAAASSYGLIGMASVITLTMDPFGSLLIMAACILLAGRLKKVQDLGGLSHDALYLGAWMLLITLAFAVALSVTMPAIVFKYVNAFISVFGIQAIVWRINIKPVREFLHGGNGGPQDKLKFWVFPRWINGGKIHVSGVACTTDIQRAGTSRQLHAPGSTSGHYYESPLVSVMGFLPLKEAFGEYCRKALCSESFQFLVDASEYGCLIHAEKSIEESKDDFDGFIAIVNEYIKDDSHSEINIDSALKTNILRFGERSAYGSLDQGDRENIFLLAEKAIAKMLAENLLSKFKATAEYKEISAGLLFEESEASP